MKEVIYGVLLAIAISIVYGMAIYIIFGGIKW